MTRTPMDTLSEVVRALEEIAPGPCTCLPYATEGSPEECASCDNARHTTRALTLARELRDNARTGWAEPYRGWDRWCFNFDPEKKYTEPDALPAILITDPNA